MVSPHRHTRQRRAVLRAVKIAGRPLSAEDVLRSVKTELPSVGPATIYRNLRLLAERGEIFRQVGEAGTTVFLGRVMSSAIFRCQRCGQTRVLEASRLNDVVQTTMAKEETITFSQLQAHGLCRQCQQELRLR